MNLRAAFMSGTASTVSAQQVSDTRRLADRIGYRGGHNLADVAQILVAVQTGDPDAARRTRTELAARTRTSGGNTYWVPVVTSWIDGVDAAAGQHPAVDWVDGPAAALGRWAQVVAPA
ncbi:hypothetical protein CD790_01060 [Streptomyces sp. SAJ15]|nr:hypothetical protein CD790_01060 [Streptomyces sp. SAJ15]